MAANDELPRGWLFTTAPIAAGSGPSLVIPAVVGIAHVVTDIKSFLWGTPAAAFTAFIRIAGVDYMAMSLTAAGGQDTEEWSGKFVGAVGAALTIDWDRVVAAGCAGMLVIQGYDV